jgi:hypothetical protein
VKNLKSFLCFIIILLLTLSCNNKLPAIINYQEACVTLIGRENCGNLPNLDNRNAWLISFSNRIPIDKAYSEQIIFKGQSYSNVAKIFNLPVSFNTIGEKYFIRYMFNDINNISVCTTNDNSYVLYQIPVLNAFLDSSSPVSTSICK